MTKKKQIGIQGVEASFHDVAARKYFGSDIETVDCISFKRLCDVLLSGEADYSVMAIENSISGSLLTNYHLILDAHLKIIGEVYLRIQQNLLALPGVDIGDINTVKSHPIALRQCAEFLSGHPDWELRERNDTAECAREIAEKGLKNAAAIASLEAAERYGLNVLEHSIETNKKNYTRFIVLSTSAQESDDNNKASVCFQLGHQVGSLAGVLNTFSEHRINLTKIQSVPIVGKPYEYSFHVDLEWKDQQDFENAMSGILRNVSNISVLGTYRKGDIASLLKTSNDEARFEHSAR